MGSRLCYDKQAYKEGIWYWSCFSTVELLIPQAVWSSGTLPQQTYTEVSFSSAALSAACETQWENVEMSQIPASIKVDSGPWLQVLDLLPAETFSFHFTLCLLLTELQSLVVLHEKETRLLCCFTFASTFHPDSIYSMPKQMCWELQKSLFPGAVWQSGYSYGYCIDSLLKGEYSRALLGNVSS